MTAPLWVVLGLLLPLLLPVLPHPAYSFVFLISGLALAVVPRLRFVLFLLAGVAWSLVHLHQRMEQRLVPTPGETIVTTGVVSGLPVVRGDMLEFLFSTDSPGVPTRAAGKEILVRWYRDWPGVEAGERWQLGLRLKPARSRLNFSGPDREAWYFSKGIAALATVIPAPSRRLGKSGAARLQKWRQQTRESISEILDQHPARSIVLSLALADRSELSAQEWTRFRVTGTSHLLAISGMHIGLAALLGFWLGRALLSLAPPAFVLRHGLRFCWFCSIAVATYYALMAGLGTSTQRALIMLVSFGVYTLSRRHAGPWQGFGVAAMVVLLSDPTAPLGAGFWLSFTAVAVLIAIFSTRHGRNQRLVSMLMAQAGLSLVLLPLGMFWFQQITLLGLAANLLAIPWVSIAVVPATLLSVLLMPLDTWLTPFLLYSAAGSAHWLSFILERLEQAGQAGWFMTIKPGLFATGLGIMGALLLLLPRGFKVRLAGIALLAPLLLPPERNRGQLALELLDVGQGLAILIKTEKQLLLYDSGPGDGRSWSLVSSVIAPAIADSGHSAPAKVIISHGDLDHAGGLSELLLRYPDAEFMASLRTPRPGTVECRAPSSWIWDGAFFEILHPGAGLPYLGNDSSCILSLTFAGHGILLPGDIGASVEQRLVRMGLKAHQFVFAPHHGSKSSSSAGFIKTLSPEFSLASTGYRNRFGFPHQSVVQRYATHGIPLWSTADCGAIRILLPAGRKAVFASARRTRKALWRWPPEPYCP